jgi:flagellar basal body-associated protein FliL
MQETTNGSSSNLIIGIILGILILGGVFLYMNNMQKDTTPENKPLDINVTIPTSQEGAETPTE